MPMQTFLDIFGWTFALLSFDLVITVATRNLFLGLIAIFIQIVFAFAYSIFLIQKINSPPAKGIRYSKCYLSRGENEQRQHKIQEIKKR
jgi:hypothetical protein